MSGIYIKGMEMPTNCSECAFCGYYGNGEHMCDIRDKAVEYESAKTSRRDDCPLIPVHGRLIDADEFTALMFADPYQDFAHIIEQMSTIIPAEGE